jgi:cardiolipin synthase A/B
VDHLGTILTVALTIYGLGMCLFLISENRRPQATLAWMLAFIFAPGIGALIYILFGRDWKAFSKQSRLLRQGSPGERSALCVAAAVPPGCGDHSTRG